MKILDVKSLYLPDVKVIRFARFSDNRGYFSEIFRKSDFENNPELSFMRNVNFSQCNESYSRPGTVRGLHFQWNPYMGKLVRTLYGRMVDLALDIRKGSPAFGRIIAYDMPANRTAEYNEWIWLPPGFAHGNFFTEESMIEYFCTSEYSPGCEAGISPLSPDLDWTYCDTELKKTFEKTVINTQLITDKDKNGFTMTNWLKDERSDKFIYGEV